MGAQVETGFIYASFDNLFGDGAITVTEGGILDADLRFDATHGTQQTLAFGSGGTLTFNIAGGPLGVGYQQNGTLTVAEGVNLTSGIGYLGYYSGSAGTASVTGAGSKWNNSSTLYVGREGSGSLTIEAGGQVSNSNGYLGYGSGSTGAATVTGAGTQWNSGDGLYVGREGSGSLTIEAGGQVSNSYGYLGYYSGSTGTATVTGAGSQWTNSGGLYVGIEGSGSLTIQAGGRVSNSHGYLGSHAGSTGTATVAGAGSKWTNSSTLYVGGYGSGSLTVADGGEVGSGYAYLGHYSGSTGTATVTGAGSKWNSSDLVVGRYGSGTLYVESGALVSVGRRLTIDYNDNNESFINLATGGMLAIYGEADGSIYEFLDLVLGTDAIRYWDASLNGWASIADATYGDDFTLEYLTSGELAGYTKLTVFTPIPEPTAVVMLGFGAMLFAAARRSRY